MTQAPYTMTSVSTSQNPIVNGTSQIDEKSRSISKTRITTRSGRSLRTSILHTGIRPFGSRLIAPKSESPGNAPDLQAPESVFDNCNVRQRNFKGLDVRLYEINARSSISTRENFIPAQIHDLRTEQNKRHEASVHETTEVLQQIQTHEDHNVISKDFGPLNAPVRRRKHIYYFAGGGWQTPPSKEHWKLCAHLAHTLTTQGHPTTVTLVSHPLAPKIRAQTTLPTLERLYYEILPSTPPSSLRPVRSTEPLTNGTTNGNLAPSPMSPVLNGSPFPVSPAIDSPISNDLALARTKTKYILQNEDVIFAGDSSGGNIALSLVLNILANNPFAKVPSSIFLISPAVDLRNTNPEILQAEKIDPMMSKKYIDSTAMAWVGNEEDKHRPEYSPILRDLSVLEMRGVAVNGVIGTADVLAPDAQAFMRKCSDTGIRGQWLEWDRQMHCFPLAFSYKYLPESNEAVDWMVGVLKEESA